MLLSRASLTRLDQCNVGAIKYLRLRDPNPLSVGMFRRVTLLKPKDKKRTLFDIKAVAYLLPQTIRCCDRSYF